jgi:hypothetical protein
MIQSFFTFIRSIGFWLAGLIMLVAVGFGIYGCIKVNGVISGTVDKPEVLFVDYAEFKNKKVAEKMKAKTDDKVQEDDKEFYELFENYFPKISENIVGYAEAMQQPIPKADIFEQKIFEMGYSYNDENRKLFLKQLSDATKKLLEYVEEDKEKKVIVWTKFMDWFVRSFENKVYEQEDAKKLNQANSITISESALTKIVLAGVVAFSVLLFLIMVLLVRRDKIIQSKL